MNADGKERSKRYMGSSWLLAGTDKILFNGDELRG